MIKTKQDLIDWLGSHELFAPGKRNDDGVNLAILMAMEFGANEVTEEWNLEEMVHKISEMYSLTFHLNEKDKYIYEVLDRVQDYLRRWEATGSIIDYAID